MKYATSGPQTVEDIPTVHRLIQGDARDLSFIADESVHLAVTSPPYWNLKRYNDSEAQMGHIESYDQFLAEVNRVWREVFRVLVPGGRLVCVVGDVCLSRRENNGRHPFTLDSRNAQANTTHMNTNEEQCFVNRSASKKRSPVR